MLYVENGLVIEDENVCGEQIRICLSLSICRLSGIHSSDKNPVYGPTEQEPLSDQIKKECKQSSPNTEAFFSHSCLLFYGLCWNYYCMRKTDSLIGADLLTLLGSKISE